MVYFRRSISSFNKILHYNDTGSIIRKCHGSTNEFAAEHLSNRTVIKVTGESSAEFLQGLITNDINSLKTSNSSTYTLLLNHKGRILYDAIIYRNTETDAFLVECDTHCAEQLTKHLKLYRLRRKIDIEPLGSEYKVWAVYNEGLVDALCNYQETQRNLPELNFKGSGKLVVEDPRVRELGYRVILKSGESLDLPSSNNYLLCRYKLGIGEGVNEIQIGQNFPLEYNCDYLNGVSFSKGCYIGQELTARTYHTGVIRKRIMPLVFEKELKDVPYDTIINDTEVRRSPIGKLKGINSIFGLGLMRVSEALENTNLMCLGVKVKVIVPYWWRVDIANKNNTILNK